MTSMTTINRQQEQKQGPNLLQQHGNESSCQNDMNEEQQLPHREIDDDGPDSSTATKSLPTPASSSISCRYRNQQSLPSNSLLLLSFFGLGSSSWVLVNAVYAQIPLIVVAFQYDYSIISKITLCITLTSLIPIIWTTVIAPTVEIKSRRRQQRQHNHQNKKSNNNKYWTTRLGISVNLLIGFGVALGLSLSKTATTQLSSLVLVSICSGIVGTMSLVLYFPHAASVSATTTTATTIKAAAATTKTIEKTGEDGQVDDLSNPNSILQQTTAMATGTAVTNLFVGVLAIVQFNVKPNNKDVLFSLQAYFGVIAGIFVLAMVGFVGTLVLPARNKRMVLMDDDVDTSPRVVAAGGIEHVHYETTGGESQKSDGNVSDTLGSNEPLVRSTSRPARNHGSISLPAPVSSQEDTVEGQRQGYVTHLSVEDGGDSDVDEGIEVSATASPKLSMSFYAITSKHLTLNGAQCMLNTLTFFLPGVVPFSVQHYEDSQRALHFLTVTQLLAQTLGIMSSGYYQNRHVTGQLVLFLVLWVPTVGLSLVNDTPFQSVQQHSAVPITINAMLQFLFGYSSTTFFHLVNEAASQNSSKRRSENEGNTSVSKDEQEPHDHTEDPHIASRVLGTWNQIGAMTGSLIAYFLVEYGVIS